MTVVLQIFIAAVTIALGLSVTVAFLDMAGALPNCRWLCSKMGWHLPPKEQKFDGCSQSGFCPRCGKRVLKDSQGNWF